MPQANTDGGYEQPTTKSSQLAKPMSQGKGQLIPRRACRNGLPTPPSKDRDLKAAVSSLRAARLQLCFDWDVVILVFAL